VLRCTALADRITSASSSVEPRVGTSSSRCLPSDESAGRSAQSGGAHTRTPAPPRPTPATAPPVPPAVRRRVPHRWTTTHARRAPMSSSVLGPAANSAAQPGSCGKPPSLLYVKSGKERDLLAFVVRWELTTFLRSGGAPRTAVHVAGPGGRPIDLPMQPRNEKFFPFTGQARTPSLAPPFSPGGRRPAAGRTARNERRTFPAPKQSGEAEDKAFARCGSRGLTANLEGVGNQTRFPGG